MMRFTKGNLLDADVEAVINTVNTVGVMGKVIALMFKERFPDNFKLYAAACKAKEVKTGRMFVTAATELAGPRWIINFPTKEHWRSRTKVEWIEEGLKDLQAVIEEKEIRSIAVPPLGCGNGGLEWPVVRAIIEKALGDLDDVEVVGEVRAANSVEEVGERDQPECEDRDGRARPRVDQRDTEHRGG